MNLNTVEDNESNDAISITSELYNKIVIIKSKKEQDEYNHIINNLNYKEKKLIDFKQLLDIDGGNNIHERIEELEKELITLIERKEELDKLENR